MFKTRLISGMILVIALLAVILPGGYVTLIATGLISIIGLFELYRVFKIEKRAVGFIGYAVLLLYYVNLKLGFESDWRTMVIIMLLLSFLIFVFTYPKYEAYQIMGAFFGLFYVGLMLSYVYLTREMPEGNYLVWLIFISSWGCDTGAYCVGMLIGKHKLTPILSPKKSIEGAIGGVVIAALLGALYGIVLEERFAAEWGQVGELAIICGIASMFSQVGDLTASAIKRNFNIKDYGKLIPGHGGIMDRFDSVIVTAPLIYYLSLYIR